MDGFLVLAWLAFLASAEPSPRDAAVEWSMQEIRKPCGPRIRLCMEERAIPSVACGLTDMVSDCPDALDFLAETTAPIDKRLLEMAQNDSRWEGRYRSTWALIQRKNLRVVPLLEKMATSPAAQGRYLGWNEYSRAIRDKKLPAPPTHDLAIKRFPQETNDEVRAVMATFFANAKLKQAVPMLLDELRKRPHDTGVVYALGCIGDPRATTAIIKAADGADRTRDIWTRDICFSALGRLATPAAVDYLIAHLGEYDVVGALLESRSPRALPALQKHLANLRSQPEREEWEVAKTRIAILRLGSPDPREELLCLAQSAMEHGHVHSAALAALQEYDCGPLAGRILQHYQGQKGKSLDLVCIRLLKDRPLAGITEAMIEHFLALEKESGSKNLMGCRHELREALGRRLQKKFRTDDQLRAYLKKQRNPGPEPR